MNRVELQIPAVLVELARHEPAVPTGHHRPQLIDQRGLAHPGRPGNQHPPAPARQRVVKRRLQHRDLLVAAHQPRGRRQPQRHIPRAHPKVGPGRTLRGVAQLLQVVRQAVGGLVPTVRLLLQQMQDDLGQWSGYGRIHLLRRHRHPRQMVVQQPQRVPRAERRRPRGQLVQRRAHRVQIGALVHRPTGAPGLLRRQIRQGPHDLTGRGELRPDLGHPRGQPEAHQAGHTVAADHDVRRADVAVHHPPPVHPGHRPGQPQPQPNQIVHRQRRGHRGQAQVTGIRQHQCARERLLRQLRHPGHTPQPLQHRQLMAQPAIRVRPQQLFTNDGSPGHDHPRHPGTRVLAHDLGPTRRLPARQDPTRPHPTPPRAAGPATYRAYTHLEGKARQESPERDPREAAHRAPWRDLPDRYGPRKPATQGSPVDRRRHPGPDRGGGAGLRRWPAGGVRRSASIRRSCGRISSGVGRRPEGWDGASALGVVPRSARHDARRGREAARRCRHCARDSCPPPRGEGVRLCQRGASRPAPADERNPAVLRGDSADTACRSSSSSSAGSPARSTPAPP